ncbi:MAG: agmatinase [Candidatus Thermoplasmatota archaeon]|nr:agmatinase [Candidatus Thermoplasmatota archaeon]
MNVNFVDLAFVGIPTFCKFPYVRELEGANADVAVVGAPLDQGTFDRPGARYGPRAIREASQIYGSAFIPELGVYDVELGRYKIENTKIIDCGDIPVAPTLCKENLDEITNCIGQVLDSKMFPVVLGGDHSITYPIIRAYCEKGIPLDIVHFDAHMDFGDDMAGITISHANPIKRASELKNVGKITQIGIRGLLNPQTFIEEGKKRGSKVITAAEAIKMGTKWVLSQIPKSKNIYVTFDIDALDPSVAPGTGTPEPGGFTYLQMREMLAALPKKGNVVGFDVVEVNPLYDPAGVTAQTAARLIIDFLAAIRDKNKK